MLRMVLVSVGSFFTVIAALTGALILTVILLICDRPVKALWRGSEDLCYATFAA